MKTKNLIKLTTMLLLSTTTKIGHSELVDGNMVGESQKPVKNADYRPIFEKTFNFEGGYQNYVDDPANYTTTGLLLGTNRGISAIALEQYMGCVPSKSDVLGITEQKATIIYKKLFWDVINGDKYHNQSVAEIIFGWYIANPAAMNRIVLESVNTASSTAFKYDDLYSDAMIETMNNTNQRKLHFVLKRNIHVFLYKLRYKRSKYIKGWLRKLDSMVYEA